MAQIPMGNFGQSVARPGPMVNAPGPSPLAGATAKFLGTSEGINNDLMAEETKQREAQMRAQSTLVLAKTQNDLHDVHDEVARGVLDGSIPTEKASAEFTDRISKVRSSALEGQMPDQRTVMDGHLERVTGSLQRNLQGVVSQRLQQDTAGAIDQFGEQMSREAMRSGPAAAVQRFGSMVDFSGQAAGLNPEKQGRMKQAFSERVHANFYEQAGLGSLEKGDIEGLRTLREQITGPDGDPLDPQKRNQLRHQFFTWERQLQAKNERDLDASMQVAEKELKKLQEFVTEGMAPDLSYQASIRATMRGTPYADAAERLIEAGNTGAGFGAQTLPRQAAALAGKAGQPTNPEDAKALAQARTIHEKQATAYKDDPWDAGARFQRLPKVAEQPILSPVGLLKIAHERIPLMTNLEAASGQPAPLLRTGEVSQAVEQLRSASLRERTEILGQIGALLGTERIGAFADQLDKSSKPLALTLKLGTDRTTSGRMASELVQIGAQALADKTVKKDDSALSGWKADISTLVRGTLGDPKAESDVIEAAYYIRAAQELDTAKAPGFTKGFGSGAEDAVAMVIGKPMERAGVKTFLPKGMSESQFDDKAMELLSAGKGQTVYMRGQPVTVESLAQRWTSYGARMVRPGEYMPMSNNAPFTVDKEGRQPLRLKVQ